MELKLPAISLEMSWLSVSLDEEARRRLYLSMAMSMMVTPSKSKSDEGGLTRWTEGEGWAVHDKMIIIIMAFRLHLPKISLFYTQGMRVYLTFRAGLASRVISGRFLGL